MTISIILRALVFLTPLVLAVPVWAQTPSPTMPATPFLSTTNATSYTVPSHTVSANRLLTVAVASNITTGPVPTPSVSGHGLTWTLVQDIDRAPDSTTTRLFLFCAKTGGSGSTDTIVVDYGASTQLNQGIAVVEWANADLSVACDAALLQKKTHASLGNSASDFTITFDAYASSDNRPYTVWRQLSASTFGLEWTGLYNEDAGAEGLAHAGMWRDATDDLTANVTVSGGSSRTVLGIGVEVKAGATVSECVGRLPLTGVGDC